MAYILSPDTGVTDRILADAASQLSAGSVALCGVIQRETQADAGHRCHMDLRILPDGPDLRISQDRGRLARGCRLDPDALETAVAETARRLSAETDLLIINKFGKHEAMGRGFRTVIATAIEINVPVLLGVNVLNLEAFEQFSGGVAVRLECQAASVLRWAERSKLFPTTDFESPDGLGKQFTRPAISADLPMQPRVGHHNQ